jgi:hypothetical protein
MRSRPGNEREAAAGAADGRPRSGRDRRIGAAAIAVVVTLTFVLAIHQGLQVNASLLGPAAIRKQTAADRREMCLYRAIRHALPKGATFYDSRADVAHFQLLAALATLWAEPRTTVGASRWQVAIMPGHCAGIRLKAWRT